MKTTPMTSEAATPVATPAKAAMQRPEPKPRAKTQWWHFWRQRPLSARKIAKATKLAANPFAQPEVRMREMQRLLKEGSPAALAGVLRRFDANAHGHIADEDEKKWLEDALVEVGSAALGPLEDYILGADKLIYALRAYRRIAGLEQAAAKMAGWLQGMGPYDYRKGEAKQQLIVQLCEDVAPLEVVSTLLVFGRDHSDDVACAALGGLERWAFKLTAQSAEQVALGVANILADPKVSQRVVRRAAELFAVAGWPVPASTVWPQSLGSAYVLDSQRLVKPSA